MERIDFELAVTVIGGTIGTIVFAVGLFFGVRKFRRYRAEMMVMTGNRFMEMSRVLLDVQGRCLDAFEKAGFKGAQKRHELFGNRRISYHLKALPNGTEHELSVAFDWAKSSSADQKYELLRSLTFLVNLSQLPETWPFDVEGQRMSITRVLTPDQTQQLNAARKSVPTLEQVQSLLLATDAEATKLRNNLR